MRTLSAPTEAATGNTVTDPAWLIELGFSAILRFSSRGNQSWNSNTWSGGRIKNVSGLQWDGSGKQTGQIELINTDLAMSSVILNEGISRKSVRIWKFYGDDPAVDDPVPVFDGLGDYSAFKGGTVIINVLGTRALYSPRRFIGPSTGFNHVRPAGKINWQGQTYAFERAKR